MTKKMSLLRLLKIEFLIKLASGFKIKIKKLCKNTLKLSKKKLRNKEKKKKS